MSTQPPAVARDGADSPLRRLRWAFWGVALLFGVAVGVGIALLRGQSTAPPAAGPVAPAGPDATWAAGSKPAPDFTLREENGAPVSLSAFRGRPVLLTFMDPQCTNQCPTEARTLEAVVARLPASVRPQIVAVSVNQWGDGRAQLRHADRTWGLRRNWHWAIGAPQALRRVWADYKIAVMDSPTKAKGVVVHNVSHTAGVFVVDRKGDQRALFLDPFTAADVARAVRQLAG